MFKRSVMLSVVIVFLIISLAYAATFVDDLESDFNSGTFNKTVVNSSSSANYTQLDSNDSEQELPSNQLVETFYGGINMSGNVLLLHLNNDSAYGENDTQVYDFSGLGNNGTVTDAVVNSSGKLSGAYSFDGVDDYVSISDPGVNFTQGSISAWIKSGASVDQGIVYTAYGGGAAEYIGMVLLSNGDIRIDIDQAVCGRKFINSTGYDYGDSLWHHVSLTFVGGDVGRLYIDGVEVDNGVSLSGCDSEINPSGDWAVGALENGNSYFSGDIDEVAIWNRSLSADEVANIYDRQKGNYISKGEFSSQVFDAGASATWNNITFLANVSRELPDSLQTETNYVNNINMTGNVLLLHLNNDSAYGENDTHVYDFSGLGNNGSVNGATVNTSGKLNGAYSFDGVDDYVDLVYDESMFISENESLAISLWVDYAGAGGTGAIGNWVSGGGVHYLYATVGTGISVRIQSPNGGGNTHSISNIITSNVWTHVVVNINRTANNMTYYVNGTLVKSFNISGNANENLSMEDKGWNVGDIGSAYGPLFFNGSIDEVAIWNRSLSATEISDIYNAQRYNYQSLNLSVRACDDDACSGENWTNIGVNPASTGTLSLINTTYFQYKTEFRTDNVSYSPELYNVTIDYDLLDTEPPGVSLNAPVNNISTASQNIIYFNFTANDGVADSVNCSLYVDSVFRDNNATTLRNVITNLNYSSIPSGSHLWNITCIDPSGNSKTSLTRSFFVDLSPPNITNIIHYPNSTEGIDPGRNLTFNVTIEDNRVPIDSVILQYYNGSDWANSTLSSPNSDSNYNTSIALVSVVANYTFNVWANDTLGNSNKSVNQTFNSTWDCTWNATSSLGSTAGWDQNKFIGNLSLNNTGDSAFPTSNCSLDFRLTHDLSEGRIFFDSDSIKPSDTYTLAAGVNQTIVVNATFETEVKEEDVIISTNEIRGRTDLGEINTTATIVSVQSGPYLSQTISSSPASVSLTDTNFTLEGYIRNLMGDATANISNTVYNVSFNWSVPSSVTNVSGRTDVEFLNISNSSRNNNDVVFEFSSLASTSPGINTFYLYAQGYNLSGNLFSDADSVSLLTQQVNITFLCYNATDGVCVTACGSTQDSDCEPETTTSSSSGGGGGGGGGSGVAVRTNFETSDAYFELLNGEQQEFKLKIDNKLVGSKKDLKISVSGINSDYITVVPDVIPEILPGSFKEITVKITAPAYFTKGEYKLIFDINGVLTSNTTNQNFQERKVVTLYIVEVSRDDADNFVNKSFSMIQAMNESGMILDEVLPFYELVKQNYEDIDFLELKNNYESLKEIHDAAFGAKNLIEDLTKRIDNAEWAGIEIIETKKILFIAEASYNRGDYILALKKLKEAELTFALETKGEFNILYTVKNYPIRSSLALLGVTVIGFIGSMGVRRRLLKRKLKLLNEEEKLLLQLMKVVQIECFEKNKMSMEEYGEAMTQYEKKLGKTIETKITAETKLNNLLKTGGKKKALNQEKDRLVELIKTTQDAYLNEGRMETRVYDNVIKTYSRRLSEIEENITFLEANEALSRKWFFKRSGNNKTIKNKENDNNFNEGEK